MLGLPRFRPLPLPLLRLPVVVAPEAGGDHGPRRKFKIWRIIMNYLAP